jgi:chromosome segregation ATPase
LTQAQSSSSAEVQELQASKEALESQVSTLQSELESIRAEVAMLQGELGHKVHALESLEESADAARTEMQTKLEESLHHAKELRLVTEKSESHSASLSMDLESLKASLEAAETRNAVMQEELRLTNEALSRSTNEAASMETLQAELTAISERHKETETEKLDLEESLRVANERLVSLEEKLKIAEENDASSAEALRNATEEAAKAKNNVASIASVSATQFAQERQMMKNALSELQTERDILVKMLKTFHTHGVLHSTTQSQQTVQAPDFAHRLAESASIAGVFTPQKKRTPYVDLGSPRSPTDT